MLLSASIQHRGLIGLVLISIPRLQTFSCPRLSSCFLLLTRASQFSGELLFCLMDQVVGVYRWVQAECRSLGDNDTPEVSDLLKAAAQSLKDRPVLFKYCAEEVANTRHNALFRRFITALTRGGPGGMPRPIEVHAHDPLRYVGDMLGWIHQALASERELAMALFSTEQNSGTTSRRFSNEASNMGSSWRAASKEYNREDLKVESDMGYVLDRVFEGVCRPFKVRVDQVLHSQPSLLLAYKLNNLLEFYGHTVSDLLGPVASLSVTIHEVCDAAQRTVLDIVKARGDKLLRYPSAVAVDLSPPPAVAETMSVLLELIDNYESMMVPAGGQKPDFEPIIQGLLDPLVQMCEQSAEAYGSKPQPGILPLVSELSCYQICVNMLNCQPIAEFSNSGFPNIDDNMLRSLSFTAPII